MKDIIRTQEVFLPPWRISGASIFGDKWRCHIFYNRQCVHALSGDSWEDVLKRAKDWTAQADIEKIEGEK